jgi:type II secretory pathway pseudopilin PulG
VSPLELVDDRFEQLASELRASRPVAPERLRERVETLARVEPEPRREWGFRLPSRRVALGLVALAILGSFIAAGITGLGGSAGKREASRTRGELGSALTETTHGAAAERRKALQPAVPHARSQKAQAELAPNRARLQRYDATLRLRVKDVDALSNATKRALSVTRALGGYVSSVTYSTRGGRRGGATLVLRVPIANVQGALGDLTALGTILRQQTAILDVTRRADKEARQLTKLEQELAQVESELASGSLSVERRAQLEARAAADRLALKTLRVKNTKLLRSARLARIVLTLTTPATRAAASPGRFDNTLDDAGAVLVRELEILLYALVVAGPLLALGGLALVAARTQRKRSDQRLLERT